MLEFLSEVAAGTISGLLVALIVVAYSRNLAASGIAGGVGFVGGMAIAKSLGTKLVVGGALAPVIFVAVDNAGPALEAVGGAVEVVVSATGGAARSVASAAGEATRSVVSVTGEVAEVVVNQGFSWWQVVISWLPF